MATIESILHENRIFPPASEFVRNANLSGREAYETLRQEAEHDYTGFWAKLAQQYIAWHKPFTRVLNDANPPFYKWFDDGELNISWNCLDRHLATQADKTAIIFESDAGEVNHCSYRELHRQVCHFANGLKSLGIRQGDRVVIYMPMRIEAVVAMQACARIGAIHSVVFGGFSAKSVYERIIDAGASAVITADEQIRGGRYHPLKATVDEALAMGDTATVHSVIVFRHTGTGITWQPERDHWWHDLIAGQPDECEPAWINAEHPLFTLYTSGSTGKPKGVQHSSAGYLLGAVTSMQWVFDYHADDVFWCTADVGWVTGHSYVAYGPLAIGATQVIFEGTPTHPHAGRFWEIIQKHRITTFLYCPHCHPLTDQTGIRSARKI